MAIFSSFNPHGTDNLWTKVFGAKEPEPIYIGIDWAAGNGFIRGEVIKRENNVTHLRFKTVGYNRRRRWHKNPRQECNVF